MKCKRIFILILLVLSQVSNASGEVVTKFENRWPFTPPKAIAASDGYIFQAFGDVILVLDKTDLTNPEPVKKIHLNPVDSEGITNITYSAPYLYVTTGLNGLTKINVSPESITDPFIVTQKPIPSLTQDEIDANQTTTGRTRGVAIKGNNAYVAFTELHDDGIYETGIQVVDIATNTTALTLKNVALVENDAIVGGLATGLTEPRNVTISGNYAYIADTAQGIHFFNISSDTPEFINITGFLPTFDLSTPGDGFAYAACTGGGIQILDIGTNPNAPSITTLYPPLEGSETDDKITYYQYNDSATFAKSIHPRGNIAYVADGNSGLEILDISNRSNPQKMESYSTNLTNAYSVYSDADNTVYIADMQSGITKINVSSPAAPSLAGSIKHDVAQSNSVFMNFEGETTLFGYTLDSSSSGEGLRILKFEKVTNLLNVVVANSEFQNVKFQSFLETPGQAKDIKVINYKVSETSTETSVVYYAFIADGTNGLAIVDVTDKATPVFATNPDVLDDAKNPVPLIIDPDYNINDSLGIDLDSSGSFAFVADGANGLRILQILFSPPFEPDDIYPVANPVLLDTIPPPAGGIAKDVLFTSKVSNLGVTEYYLYIAAGNAGLQIIQLNLPDPGDDDDTITGTHISTIDTTGDAKKVDVYDKYAFVADGASGLQIFNISDPTAPYLVGSYDTPGDASGIWVGITSTNKVYAYIADGYSGMRIIDVSNPTEPSELENLTSDTAGFASDLAVNQTGDMAVVADGSGGLTMLSMQEENPVDTGPLDVSDIDDINDSGCFITSIEL